MRRRGWVALGVGAACALWIAWPVDVPEAPAAVRVLDRHGELVAERPAPERARGTWLTEIPPRLEAAVLAAEDHRFYRHPGVDPIGVARALRADLAAGAVVQGGSTITQQLARALWTRPPGLRGKLWEAALALRLEAHLSKQQILVEYCNRIYYGNLAYGADAASRLYLDKPVTALSWAEAAFLAALPRSPARLDPWRDLDAALAARDRVLDRMRALGSISADDHALARAEPLTLRRDPPVSAAPHFVRRVLEQAGAPSETDAQGRVLHTTLDLRLQQAAERYARDTIARLSDRGATQAVVVVADTRTAEVLAYVGSAGWTAPDGQVDGAMAPRSPGSALKPFAYWLGLERRGGKTPALTLATLLADLPSSWTTPHGTWSPQNYDQHYHGPVTARYALAGSLNLPAVRVAEAVGVADLQRRLQDLGVTTLPDRPDHYGLGLVLGGAELRLDELLAAYVALANGGRARPLAFSPGSHTIGRAVGDRDAAWLVVDALDDPAARSASFGVDSVLEADFPLAAKTGTSVGWRDNWAFGMTPQVVAGAWVGNFDGRSMVDVSGVTGAGPLLRDVLEAAWTGARTDFDRPDAVIARRICPLSGMLPGERCPGTRVEWFLPGTVPSDRCDWHQTVQVDTQGALATGCPGAVSRLVVRWPAPYAAWAEESGKLRWPEVDRSCAPSAVAARPERPGIAWPNDGVAFYLDPRDPLEQQAIPLRASVPAGARQAIWSVDGVVVASGGPPWTARWVPTPGDHQVSLVVDGAPAGSVHVWVGGGAP